MARRFDLRLLGLPLRIHPSWVFAVALTVLAAGSLLPEVAGATSPYLAGLAIALLLFASILLHELAHAAVARRLGLPVRRIVLYFFGGTTEIEADALQPRSEALVALAGPLSNLLLAGLAGLSWLALRPVGGPAESIAQVVTLTNGSLCLFTLLPGYPLDGGRIVRAGLWYLSDDLLTATRWAARYGSVIAWGGMIAAGYFLFRSQSFIAAALAGTSWFLLGEARHGYRDLLWHQLSRQTPAIHAAFLQPPRIPTARILDEAADDVLEGMGLHGEGGPSLVVDEQDHPIGILGIDQLRAVRRARWTTTTASEAMIPLAQIPAIPPDQQLHQTMALLAGGHHRYGVIISATPESHGLAVGVITPQRIMRYLNHDARLASSKHEPVVTARVQPNGHRHDDHTNQSRH